MKKHEWRALPGRVLAYGDTGFEIHLNSDPKKETYTAFDPEGRTLGNASTLAYIQGMVQTEAADRAKFEVPS